MANSCWELVCTKARPFRAAIVGSKIGPPSHCRHRTLTVYDLAPLLLMSYTLMFLGYPRALISLTFMLGLIGVGSLVHADDLGSSDLRRMHSSLAIVLKNCSISNPIISAETSERPDTSIVPPPYVPPTPLEVWIAFGPIAAGGLLILVLYILNMWGK
jgi:hypothetical protein